MVQSGTRDESMGRGHCKPSWQHMGGYALAALLFLLHRKICMEINQDSWPAGFKMFYGDWKSLWTKTFTQVHTIYGQIETNQELCQVLTSQNS